MRGYNEDLEIKKGPWTAEEDEVLLKFVHKYGPRDWSSIRSKGLLPRTGKSCRLRWVNKLRPNLKVGCKFTAEEERMVIDLQARLGNKWATIASYLQGRTDNDVKNFWSTRQKRLARILQSSSQPNKSLKCRGQSPVVPVHEVPSFQPSTCNPIEMKEAASSSDYQPQPSPYMINTQVLNSSNPRPQACTANDPSTQVMFTQLNPHPKLDLPYFPECQDFVTAFGEPNCLDLFPHQNGSAQLESAAHFNFALPFFGFKEGCGGSSCSSQNFVGQGDLENLANADILFEDFPIDVFDSLEPFPSSSAIDDTTGSQNLL
ncbi:hypothetical protein Ancab_033281 [Ancistrocladus abbreviatus]